MFGNIVKYIKMGASSNFGNMFSVLGASAFLPFLPMAPVQILTNNLLYDFSQTAIPTDNVDAEYIAKPRKWDIAQYCPLHAVHRAHQLGLRLRDVFPDAVRIRCVARIPPLFQTGWFVESLLSQTLIIHVIRTGRIPFLQSRPSLPLLVTTLLICGIGAFLPYSHFAHALGLVPLPLEYWFALTGILVLYLGLTQVVKGWLIRQFGLG